MAKPALLIVDDDPEVLRAVARDLRREYGAEYRVLRADSGEVALEALKQLKLSGDPVALFLVDQRMPGLTGVEFLEEAVSLFPEVKRVLLTAYADTDAAISAINSVNVDYYLLKPWDPPEEQLYPVLNDLLDDWQAGYRPPFEGIRVIGHRWSPKSHQVKEFLAQNQVPYRWFDLEMEPEARELLEYSGLEAPRLPLVLFPDGAILEEPSSQQVAAKAGLQTQAEKPFYDLIVVGAGPAGLAAGVYGGSEGLHTLIIERQAPGGQAVMSSRIENYPGFPVGLSGGDLARRAVTQVRRFGVEVLSAQEATGLCLNDPYRGVVLADGNELSGYALLITTGVSYRRLEVPHIENLTGAGVYYGAALTEGKSVQGEEVYIVGGANSAGQAAMYFSEYAKTVTMLVRGDSLSSTMSQYLIDRIEATENIRVWLNTEVAGLQGEDHLEAITFTHIDTGQSEAVSATALFIFIGAVPHTDWLGDAVARDEYGFILSGFDLAGKNRPKGWPLERDPFPLETSLPGVFVAGDVRCGSAKRVVTAVGEGAMAVMFIHKYLSEVGA
ncbi:MAG: FAD-dependent oxidoreductase [Candidatus Bipolaricaulia bacterium]